MKECVVSLEKPSERREDGSFITEKDEEARDELLFAFALEGRVPLGEIYEDEQEDVLYLCYFHKWGAEGYYVGRAKAMKAYKTKDYKQYYLTK